MLRQLTDWLTDYTTYTGYLYLMLVLPVTMIAFTILVVGLSLGAALLTLLIGLPIIGMTLVLARWIAKLDVLATKHLLGADIASVNQHSDASTASLIDSIKYELSNTTNWRSLLYCFAKVPLSVFTSIVMVIATVISLVMMGMPLYYENPNTPAELLGVPINSMPRAVATAVLSIALLVVTMMIVRMTVWLWRKFTKYVLITDDNAKTIVGYNR